MSAPTHPVGNIGDFFVVSVPKIQFFSIFPLSRGVKCESMYEKGEIPHMRILYQRKDIYFRQNSVKNTPFWPFCSKRGTLRCVKVGGERVAFSIHLEA